MIFLLRIKRSEKCEKQEIKLEIQFESVKYGYNFFLQPLSFVSILRKNFEKDVIQMEQIPFRYDIVGSFLRPERLKQAREQVQSGQLSREQLKQIEDEEIRQLIRQQKDVGLKAVTDGEFRRRWWHLDFLAGLEGTTVYDFTSDAFGVSVPMQSCYLSGPLSFPAEHPFLEHFRFTQEAAGEDLVVKQTIPGPGMALISPALLSQEYRQHPVYGSQEALFQDIAQTYQTAIQAFCDAGCRYLQLDDTSWGTLFNQQHRQRLAALGHDPDKLIQDLGDLTEQALAKRPRDMAITMHFCKGNFMSRAAYTGTYDRIAKRLLAIENFDGFFLEYDDQRSGSFAPLANAKNQRIVLGLITTKNGTLENPEVIKARITEAAKVVPLDQLCLSPQCGFSSTQEGNTLSEEAQWEKLRLLRSIAEEVWQDA